jgi:hypothetical protein
MRGLSDAEKRALALADNKIPANAGCRQKAIEAVLRRIDLVGIVPECQDEAEYYTLQNALSWRIDRLIQLRQPKSRRALLLMASISTPSAPKSTCRRTRCSCCSKVCSTPHKQSACCCSAKFGARASRLDRRVRGAETVPFAAAVQTSVARKRRATYLDYKPYLQSLDVKTALELRAS